MINQRNKKVVDYLFELIKKIDKNYSLNCVILFGSQARGDFEAYSDIDLILIGDFKEKFTKRGDLLYENHNWKWGLDAFCYTPQEFDEMFSMGIISILDAIDEGICLSGEDFFEAYKAKLKILKDRGLRKDPPVWILPKSMKIE